MVSSDLRPTEKAFYWRSARFPSYNQRDLAALLSCICSCCSLLIHHDVKMFECCYWRFIVTFVNVKTNSSIMNNIFYHSKGELKEICQNYQSIQAGMSTLLNHTHTCVLMPGFLLCFILVFGCTLYNEDIDLNCQLQSQLMTVNLATTVNLAATSQK